MSLFFIYFSAEISPLMNKVGNPLLELCDTLYHIISFSNKQSTICKRTGIYNQLSFEKYFEYNFIYPPNL